MDKLIAEYGPAEAARLLRAIADEIEWLMCNDRADEPVDLVVTFGGSTHEADSGMRCGNCGRCRGDARRDGACRTGN